MCGCAATAVCVAGPTAVCARRGAGAIASSFSVAFVTFASFPTHGSIGGGLGLVDVQKRAPFCLGMVLGARPGVLGLTALGSPGTRVRVSLRRWRFLIVPLLLITSAFATIASAATTSTAALGALATLATFSSATVIASSVLRSHKVMLLTVPGGSADLTTLA